MPRKPIPQDHDADSHDSSAQRSRVKIPVSHGGHGDDGPPERIGEALVLFEPSESDAAQNQDHQDDQGHLVDVFPANQYGEFSEKIKKVRHASHLFSRTLRLFSGAAVSASPATCSCKDPTVMYYRANENDLYTINCYFGFFKNPETSAPKRQRQESGRNLATKTHQKHKRKNAKTRKRENAKKMVHR